MERYTNGMSPSVGGGSLFVLANNVAVGDTVHMYHCAWERFWSDRSGLSFETQAVFGLNEFGHLMSNSVEVGRQITYRGKAWDIAFVPKDHEYDCYVYLARRHGDQFDCMRTEIVNPKVAKMTVSEQATTIDRPYLTKSMLSRSDEILAAFGITTELEHSWLSKANGFLVNKTLRPWGYLSEYGNAKDPQLLAVGHIDKLLGRLSQVDIAPHGTAFAINDLCIVQCGGMEKRAPNDERAHDDWLVLKGNRVLFRGEKISEMMRLCGPAALRRRISGWISSRREAVNGRD